MAENFKLPISSYDELIKIIQAYSSGKEGQPLPLVKLSQLTRIDKSTISGNNGFLTQLELIEKGNKKSPTEKGLNLGRAYNNKIEDVSKSIWTEIIENNEFLNRMLSAVRIRSGMDRASFINHIIYSSGLNATPKSKAGAGAIVEILKYAELVIESDDKIMIGKTISIPQGTNGKVPIKTAEITSIIKNKISSDSQVSIKENNKCQIVLNININSTVNDLDKLTEKIKNFIKEINQ